MNPDDVHTVQATEGGFHIMQGGHPVDDVVYVDAAEAARRCAYLNHVEAHYYTVLTGASRIVVALLAAGIHRLDGEALLARALENIGAADERDLRAFAAPEATGVA